MRSEQAWAITTMMLALTVFAVVAAMVSLGGDPYQVGALGVIAVVVYLYVVYKRYHIELVTQGDIALFSDPEDLKILCEIYSLGGTGRPLVDRQRLKNFVRAHPGRAFVWVAPRPVRSLGSALSVPEPEREEELTVHELVKKLTARRPSDASLRGSLVWDSVRRPGTEAAPAECPVCESRLDGRVDTCPRCGADLAFYSALADSRLVRRLLSEKTSARKRRHG
jgi:hypothetical protein